MICKACPPLFHTTTPHNHTNQPSAFAPLPLLGPASASLSEWSNWQFVLCFRIWSKAHHHQIAFLPHRTTRILEQQRTPDVAIFPKGNLCKHRQCRGKGYCEGRWVRAASIETEVLVRIHRTRWWRRCWWRPRWQWRRGAGTGAIRRRGVLEDICASRLVIRWGWGILEHLEVREQEEERGGFPSRGGWGWGREGRGHDGQDCNRGTVAAHGSQCQGWISFLTAGAAWWR